MIVEKECPSRVGGGLDGATPLVSFTLTDKMLNDL
jgi:hypothetical protein